MNAHPCLTCGACCAHFSALFHWSETLPESYHVPVEMTVPASPHLDAMKGTNEAVPRCVALEGAVGESVSCSVYERRPHCCRVFKPSYEDGVRNVRCEQARLAKGMPALKPGDFWPAPPLPLVPAASF
jgi:Fe-S-cluster containining protein